MDHLQQHIEQAMPKNEAIEQSIFQNSFLKPKLKGEVLILPSPTPSGDQLMHEIEQRNPIFKAIAPMPTPMRQPLSFSKTLSSSLNVINTTVNSAVPPPPPIHIRSPPTPPPLDKLKTAQKRLKFNPDRINEYKVKGNGSPNRKLYILFQKKKLLEKTS